MKNAIPVIITHPCTLFREGLRQILTGTQFKPVHIAPDLDETAEKSLASSQTCVWLMGMKKYSAAVFDGLHEIKARKPELMIVVLTECRSAEEVLPALEAGASGFLDHDISCERLIKSLELIVLGETVVPTQFLHAARKLFSDDHVQDAPQAVIEVPVAAPATTPSVMTSEAFTSGSCLLNGEVVTAPQRLIADGGNELRLSSREMAILRLFMEGASNKAIARQLAITEATVKVHNKAILRKLRLQNRTQAAVWAHSHLGEARDRLATANGTGTA